MTSEDDEPKSVPARVVAMRKMHSFIASVDQHIPQDEEWHDGTHLRSAWQQLTQTVTPQHVHADTPASVADGGLAAPAVSVQEPDHASQRLLAYVKNAPGVNSSSVLANLVSMSLEGSGGRHRVQGALEAIATGPNGFQNCADVVKTLTTDAVLRTLEELEMVRRASAHMMSLASEVEKERATSAAAAAATAACVATRAANAVYMTIYCHPLRPWYSCPNVNALKLSNDTVEHEGVVHRPLIYTVDCLAAGGEVMCAKAYSADGTVANAAGVSVIVFGHAAKATLVARDATDSANAAITAARAACAKVLASHNTKLADRDAGARQRKVLEKRSKT